MNKKDFVTALRNSSELFKKDSSVRRSILKLADLIENDQPVPKNFANNVVYDVLGFEIIQRKVDGKIVNVVKPKDNRNPPKKVLDFIENQIINPIVKPIDIVQDKIIEPVVFDFLLEDVVGGGIKKIIGVVKDVVKPLVPKPTPTRTITPTPSVSITPTPSLTVTPTVTPSITPSVTISVTPSTTLPLNSCEEQGDLYSLSEDSFDVWRSSNAGCGSDYHTGGPIETSCVGLWDRRFIRSSSDDCLWRIGDGQGRVMPVGSCVGTNSPEPVVAYFCVYGYIEQIGLGQYRLYMLNADAYDVPTYFTYEKNSGRTPVGVYTLDGTGAPSTLEIV